MADEDITLDGKPLQSLRVADLKAALEQRNLPKSGQKNTLIKRLKGALMLENLQKSSSSHCGLQPNSQIGEEMCQNSFIKQYLAKQQELLRQRLEREAQQDEEADESPAVPEEDEEHSEDNDSSCYASEKHHPVPSQATLVRAEERGTALGMSHDPAIHHQETSEAPSGRMQHAIFHQGHKEPPAPSPPRAVASLSVRVLGQPDQQGLPPTVSGAQEKEGAAPSDLGSAHPVLHLSRSAGLSQGSNIREESDDNDEDDDESEDDEDWGPDSGAARRVNRVPPQPHQMSRSAPSAVARSKRKLQPPQHIPPPQVHHTSMQLRHPTPPPSPPPNLFPLPDTPKQSPPDADDQEGLRVVSFPSPTMQGQDSDASSRSSSPEPPMKRRPGPLSLLIHKMESEGARRGERHTSAGEMSEETAHCTAGSSSESPPERLEKVGQQEMEEERRLNVDKDRERQQGQEREVRKAQEQEREKICMEKGKNRLEEKNEKQHLNKEQEKERKCQEDQKEKGRRCQDEKKCEEKQSKEKQDKRCQNINKDMVVVTERQDLSSSSDSDSKSDSFSHSSQSSSSSMEIFGSARQLKKAEQGQEAEDEKKSKQTEKQYLLKREVSEPSAAAVTEVEPDSESSLAQQPASGTEPENTEGRLEEVPMPLPLSLMVPAEYYYYHQHQHLLHFSYSSYNSCPAMPKCVAGT